jgi:hypothetical protein
MTKSKGIIKNRIRNTTLSEAKNRIYRIIPQKNGYGNYTAGVTHFPKCLMGHNIKIKLVKECIK